MLGLLAASFALQLAPNITIKDGHFATYAGPIWISGANTPWQHWNDFGGNFDPAWWDAQFAALRAHHVVATRVWISCNGDNPSPGIQPDGHVTSPRPRFWGDVDRLFDIARRRRLYLMIAPISFDHTKAGNHNADAWRNMQRSAENRASFVANYIVPLVQRYRSNPYFFAVDVGNELDWHWDNQGLKQSDTVDLVARVANAVHGNSSALVCLGMGTAAKYLSAKYQGNCLSDASLSAMQPGARVDFYNIHYYDWVKQWFGCPFDSSPDGMGILGKPAIVGECPAKGSDGESIEANYRGAFEHGWQGVMPWTSNGVDGNGSFLDMAPGADWFARSHPNLVR